MDYVRAVNTNYGIHFVITLRLLKFWKIDASLNCFYIDKTDLFLIFV